MLYLAGIQERKFYDSRNRLAFPSLFGVAYRNIGKGREHDCMDRSRKPASIAGPVSFPFLFYFMSPDLTSILSKKSAFDNSQVQPSLPRIPLNVGYQCKIMTLAFK
ncbi:MULTISPECIES: hypothetical protein [Methylobacter]|jgi:hypothetical protein|uniref:hypothetical protein n=1 Tax=Methylobacter TaxID=429 RepID=UPI00035C9130|nr:MULTISPECIES: hypothetical protein [Methylobacter]